jgi:NADPH:quinone reductase-like Zn-dependent oxidoreductase
MMEVLTPSGWGLRERRRLGRAPPSDLARLVRLLEQRKLAAPVEFEAPWQDIGRAIDALLTRTISGKAVLHVHQPNP